MKPLSPMASSASSPGQRLFWLGERLWAIGPGSFAPDAPDVDVTGDPEYPIRSVRVGIDFAFLDVSTYSVLNVWCGPPAPYPLPPTPEEILNGALGITI